MVVILENQEIKTHLLERFDLKNTISIEGGEEEYTNMIDVPCILCWEHLIFGNDGQDTVCSPKCPLHAYFLVDPPGCIEYFGDEIPNFTLMMDGNWLEMGMHEIRWGSANKAKVEQVINDIHAEIETWEVKK